MLKTAIAIGRWTAQVLVGVFAGVATLVVLATLLFRILYPEEKLKELVLGLVNESLQGEVTVGPVFISPLTGLVVRDLAVLSSEQFDRAPAVRLDEFVLRYDLGEFLADGRVSVDVAEARGVRVNLIEVPGLGWNVEHLVAPSEEETPPFTWDSLPVDVRLRRLSVQELDVTVSDDIAASLGGLSMVMGGFDTGNPGPVLLEIRKEPGPVSLRLGPVEAPQAAGRIDEMSLKLDLTVPGDPIEATAVSGDFHVAASGINLSAPLEFAPEGELVLRGTFDADLTTMGVNLTGGRLTLGDYLCLGLEAAATLGGEPRAAVKLDVEKAELGPLARDFSPILPDIVAAGGVSGTVGLDVRLDESFAPRTAEVEARLDLAQVEGGMALPDGPARVVGLNGTLALKTLVELDDPRPVVDLAADLSILSAEQGPYSAGNLTLAANGTVDLAGPSATGLKVALKVGHLSSTGEPGPLLASNLAVDGTFSADIANSRFIAEGLRMNLGTLQVAGMGLPGPVSLDRIDVTGSLAADLNAGNVSLKGMNVDLGDALHWRGAATVNDFGRGGVSARLDEFAVNLDRALGLIPPGMVELPPVKPVGEARVRGWVELAPGALDDPDPLALLSSLRTHLVMELTGVSVGLPQGGADGIDANLALDFDSGDGDLELDASVADVVLTDLPVPVQGVKLAFKGRLERQEELFLETLDLGVDSLDLSLTGSGAVSDLLGTPIAALNLQGRAGRIGQPLKLSAGMADVEGQVGLELALRGPVQGPKPMQISGRLRFHQINFRQVGFLAVTGIEGELPIDNKVVISAPLPLPGTAEERPSPFGERRYELLAPFTPPPDLTIDEVRLTGGGMPEIRVNDLELTWGVTGGGLHIWRLAAKALGGSLVGRLNLLLTDVVPAFSLQLEFSDVNVGYLIEGVEPTEGAEINGDLRLSGSGADFDDIITRFDLEGSANITRIGKEVLDKMLLFLDPEGTNPSIIQVRGLLGSLQKQPDLVTMDLKNQRMTLKIRVVDTGFSLLSLFTSFIDLSEFTIPRIPIADIMRRYMLPETQGTGVDIYD